MGPHGAIFDRCPPGGEAGRNTSVTNTRARSRLVALQWAGARPLFWWSWWTPIRRQRNDEAHNLLRHCRPLKSKNVPRTIPTSLS